MSFLPSYSTIQSQPEAPHTVFVLHGILGSQRNWRSFVRRLSQEHPSCRFVLVDQRHHGNSKGAPAPHTLDSCADDLVRLSTHLGLRIHAIWGHSFGGKVALTYAQRNPPGLRSVWTLDTNPAAGFDGQNTNEAEQVIRDLRAIRLPATSRASVTEQLQSAGYSKALAQWMTTNLQTTPAGLTWCFNLDGVEALLRSYRETTFWPLLEGPATTAKLHILRAARSDRWSQESIERLEALPSHIHVELLPDAGHWVQVDNADGLRVLLTDTLERESA